MKIYLARHGQDQDNVNKILNGQRDEPLTELGLAQAVALAEHIKGAGLHFDAVYASPLQRAFKTAEIISDIAGEPKPRMMQGLIERDFGVMTGQPIAKIEEMCAPDIIKADIVTYFLKPEGGESFSDVLVRARHVLDALKGAHAGQSVLLVSHGDLGKMLYAEYYHIPWESVLTDFHFGNSELLLLSEDSPASETHVFSTTQHNH